MKGNKTYLIVLGIRLLVGLLFIFSGLIKANDPLGLSYKMQEFFEVWNLQILNDYALWLSIAMNTFEIVAGFALIIGVNMQLYSWLILLLTIFFTFLTGYAVVTDKVKECGCFGNCIPLSALQSFYKDLILLVLIVVILWFRKGITPLISFKKGYISLCIAALMSLGLMWYSLQFLPIVDCLPFKPGNRIIENMKIPEGSIPDSTVITFVYQHNGQSIEFGATEFPNDFNDTSYQFVKRYDKLVRKGNATPAIKDFALMNQEGVDITMQVLQEPGYKIFLFLRHDALWNPADERMNAILKRASELGCKSYLVTSMDYETLKDQYSAFEYLSCDATAIKTAARHNPTLFLINGDSIINKWSAPNFDKALRYLQNIKHP